MGGLVGWEAWWDAAWWDARIYSLRIGTFSPISYPQAAPQNSTRHRNFHDFNNAPHFLFAQAVALGMKGSKHHLVTSNALDPTFNFTLVLFCPTLLSQILAVLIVPNPSETSLVCEDPSPPLLPRSCHVYRSFPLAIYSCAIPLCHIACVARARLQRSLASR